MAARKRTRLVSRLLVLTLLAGFSGFTTTTPTASASDSLQAEETTCWEGTSECITVRFDGRIVSDTESPQNHTIEVVCNAEADSGAPIAVAFFSCTLSFTHNLSAPGHPLDHPHTLTAVVPGTCLPTEELGGCRTSQALPGAVTLVRLPVTFQGTYDALCREWSADATFESSHRPAEVRTSAECDI